MTGELRDIGVILDGTDPMTDVVQASVALQLSHCHGACLTVFVQNDHDIFERSARLGCLNDPLCDGVAICGLRDVSVGSDRRGPRSPVEILAREAQSDGRWIRRLKTNDLLQRIRCVDLIIAGAPLKADVRSGTAADDVVARAGRPVLVLPHKFARKRPHERHLGFRVLIAWNASAESARATHDALPFLKRAEEVTLLLVNEEHDQIRTQHAVATFAEHLSRHGVKVRPEVIPSADAWPSRIILDRLDELDADLLVMGAFSRSKLRESWFGGVSDELLHATSVPVLTSH